MRTTFKLFITFFFMIMSCSVSFAKAVQTSVTTDINGKTVKVEFYTPSIIRVSISSGNKAVDKKSYSVILKKSKLQEDISVRSYNQYQELGSECITVRLDAKTGEVSFYDKNKHLLLRADKYSLTPCTNEVDKGKYKISQTFRLDGDECIFGLGQLRDEAMNMRGHSFDIWNHNTYISIPYFTSEKGYGLYWDNAGRTKFSDNENGTTFTSEVGECIDYYFMYKDGSQDGVISCIRELSGKATMFPKWSMGFWQCRERYKTSDELAAVLDKYRELQIPLDGIVQDWQYWGCDSNWNAMRFMNPYYINKVNDEAWKKYLPDDMRNMTTQQESRLKSPEEMVKYVHQNNSHLMISIWANFGPWTDQYKELSKIGALYPFDTWPRGKGVMPYDVFNPKARDIYWKYLSYLYKMGFDAWWTDSTEPDHFEKAGDDDWMTYDGSWRSVKNAFPLLHNKGIYEHQRKMKGNKKRSVQMTRSGSFGIQHYGTFSWSGDVVASWKEMKNQVPSGLNFTLCGIPFWNTDLGGFFYREYEQNPKNPAIQELQTRWMQWGTFMPLMRNHCSSPMVSELYEFGQKGDWCYDVIVDYIKLRYRLLPYIYSTAGDCYLNDGSMMRPFVMDFAYDKKAIQLNDEYMFGRNILVKPVTDPLYTWKDEKKKGHEIYPDLRKASAPVSVYLPKITNQPNTWYDFWTNEKYEGGKEILRPCPIDIMPVFVKAGTILPWGPEVQYSNEKAWDDIEIRIYPGADGSFTLYEDEGDGYAYEQGKYTIIPFCYDESTKTLTIHGREGGYDGMLKQRTFRIRLIGSDANEKVVTYTGKEVKVSL